MDDLANQVQSLFYHDVHFNAINTRMLTELECRTPAGLVSKQTFRVDMGMDGNLMPITMFAKLYAKISLETLEKTPVEHDIKSYACTNTPIRQFGVFSIKVSFKGKFANSML